MRKKILAAMVLALTLMMNFTVQAGSWVDTYGDGKIWQYQDDDGTLAENTWVETDGKWYYIGQYGYMYQQAVTPDHYLVGDDGTWNGMKLDSYDSTDQDVKDAYKEIVQSTRNLEDYCLYDADQDGTPELFVRTGTCAANETYHVYTCKGEGTVVQIGKFNGQNGGLKINKEGQLYCDHGHMGYYVLESVIWNDDTSSYHTQTVYEAELAEGEDYSDLTAGMELFDLYSYDAGDLTPFNAQ